MSDALLCTCPVVLDVLGRNVPEVPTGWRAQYENSGWCTVYGVRGEMAHALWLGGDRWLVTSEALAAAIGTLRAPPRALRRAATDPEHPRRELAASLLADLPENRLTFDGNTPRLHSTMAGHEYIRIAREADGDVVVDVRAHREPER